MADDPSAAGVVYFGGWSGAAGTETYQTWIYSAGNWSRSEVGENPPPVQLPSLAYDPFDGYDLLVGGDLGGCSTSSCDLPTDQWTYSDGGWENVTERVNGSIPREDAGGLVADSAGRCMVDGLGVIGWSGSGINAVGTIQPYFYDFSNGTWAAVGVPVQGPGPLPVGPIAGSAAVVGGVMSALALVTRRRFRGATDL
jgi:hypothetical protein